MAEEQNTFKPGNRKYIYSIGRRKSAIAQLRLYPKGSGQYIVNKKKLGEYFPTQNLKETALKALEMNNLLGDFDATVHVTGGGVSGQADAVKLAFARALIEHDEGYKQQVKKAGLLTRDARVKERKKPGLKGARRAPQWSKR